jgi:hypothetical protein
MQDYLFAWYSDANSDGIPETLRYSTNSWLPNLDKDDCGRTAVVNVLQAINLDPIVIQLGRPGKYDSRQLGQFELNWEIADSDLIPFVNYDYSRQNVIGIRLDHRWRQLRVTSNATNQVTVAKGYYHYNNDVYYLLADANITLTNETKVYATPSTGLVTVGATASTIPEGSVLLSNISIASGVVSILSSPSGVANMRTCKILSVDTPTIGGGNTALTVRLQEV